MTCAEFSFTLLRARSDRMAVLLPLNPMISLVVG